MKQLMIWMILSVPFSGIAQLFEEEDYDYDSEVIWGINKNTNGGLIGGLILKTSKSIGKNTFQTYGLELSNVKHPEEVRYSGVQGQAFIYGKSNYLYAIRFQYGRERLIFRKANQQGVQINAGVSAGPSLGLVNPYYILTPAGEYEPFDPLLYPSPETIAGPGRLLQGLPESKVVVGLNAKGSMLFEFGTYKSSVAGVEIGVMAEAYTQKIIIIPTQPSNALFSSLFFSLYWGFRS